MKLQEAREFQATLQLTSDIKAEVVRILPESVDPIKEGDNGWDVELTVEGL